MATPRIVFIWGHFLNNRLFTRRLFRTPSLHLHFSNGIHRQNIASSCRRRIAESLILSAVGFTTGATAKTVGPLLEAQADSEKRNAGDNKLNFEPNDPRLRSHECLKNAAGLSVDSSSAVLSQTVHALTKIETEYVELVNVLIVLTEYQLQVLGHTAEEERIGDLIVETRHEIDKVRRRKEDLKLLFGSVERLADATAEVAFAAGAEYASTCAGERLYSAQREVRRVQAETEAAERRLHETQARSVEVLSQHEERKHTVAQTSDSESTDGHQGTETQTSEPRLESTDSYQGTETQDNSADRLNTDPHIKDD